MEVVILLKIHLVESIFPLRYKFDINLKLLNIMKEINLKGIHVNLMVENAIQSINWIAVRVRVSVKTQQNIVYKKNIRLKF